MAQRKDSSRKRKVGRPKKVAKRKKPRKKVSRPYVKPKSKSIDKVNVSNKSKSIRDEKDTVSHITNYNRVRKVLWEKYKGEYKSYREFISSKKDENGNKIPNSNIVSQVLDECRGTYCDDDDIVSIYISILRPANRDEEEPIILDFFYEKHPFWAVLGNDFMWELLPDNLWIKAPMFFHQPSAFLGNLGKEIIRTKQSIEVDKHNSKKSTKEDKRKQRDGAILGYRTLFRPFVDYCNSIFGDSNSDEIANITMVNPENGTTSPFWNDAEKRWELEIVICDTMGNINDFGFVPEDGVDISDSIASKITNVDETNLGNGYTGSTINTPQTTETSNERELKLQAELEREKQKTLELELKVTKSRTIENATKLLLEGKIDQEMFKFIVSNA